MTLVDGRKEGTWKNATVNTSLGSKLYIGADIHGSETLDGAVDEVARLRQGSGRLAGRGAAPRHPQSAADGRAVRRSTPVPSPLPSRAPTLTSAPTAHEYQDNLVAYYLMTHGKLTHAHASEFHGKVAEASSNLTFPIP